MTSAEGIIYVKLSLFDNYDEFYDCLKSRCHV